MFLRRRLWSLSIIFFLALSTISWIGFNYLGVSADVIVFSLALALLFWLGQLCLVEFVFTRPLRRRLQKLDDTVRAMDPAPPPPRLRPGDELDAIRADLQRLIRRFDETRGDLNTKKIRAEVDSRTDPLTKLYNHRSFVRFAMDEWERAQHARAPLAMIILDVDKFKSINDDFGHQVGNQALEKVANAMRESVRASDLAFRYAGDEFAVLLPRSGLEQAVRVAEKIRLRVQEEYVESATQRRQLSLSIGTAELRPEMRSYEDLVTAADRALYFSKEGGRNVVAYAVGRGAFRLYRPEEGG